MNLADSAHKHVKAHQLNRHGNTENGNVITTLPSNYNKGK